MMAERAFEKPASIAPLTDEPALSSSLIRANMITLASTAIPTERIIPAIPGSVRVSSNRFMNSITRSEYRHRPIELARPGIL